MPSLPTGTVTFLFTDIEGSTRLLQRLGDRRYADVLAEHQRMLRDAFAKGHGQEVDTQGDAFLVAFARARDAVAAAVAAQQALMKHAWPDGALLQVRMGLHTGEPVSETGSYIGLDVHRAARICSAGHGSQILLSQTVADLAARDLPTGVSLRDLGTHRLKDLREPEHLLQVVHPDLPADYLPVKSLDCSSQQPSPPTDEFHRTREGDGRGQASPFFRLPRHVDRLRRSRQDQACAPGGRRRGGRLPGWGVGRGIRANRGLSACPEDRRFRTKRPRATGPGIDCRVPSLSLPDLKRLPPPETLTRYEAVRLFVERAAFSKPGFQITSSNAAAVAQVTHRLDGIPFAIELAAARVNALPVDTIAARLDDQFRLLTGGSRTGLHRQQTLRATLDWSYNLLSDQERVLLRRFSVFAGGFTLEAAEQICAGEGVGERDILDLLTRLVDKSLVVFDEREGQARYRLLESVRQYGADRLQEAGGADHLRRRHRDWYLALAEGAKPELRGTDQGMWLDRLDAEHDNLRAALGWSRQSGEAEAGLRLAGALVRFWSVRGNFEEGRERLASVLSLVEASELTARRAEALDGAGLLAWRQGDHAAARALYEESLTIWRALGDKSGIAQTLNHLGALARQQGDYTAAIRLYKESLATQKELGNKLGIASALNNLGLVAREQGDHAAACALHEEGLAIEKASGDKLGIALALNNLGLVAASQQEYSLARSYYEQSLDICRDLGDKGVIISYALNNLGNVTYHQGDFAEARALITESLAIKRELGDRLGIAYALNTLGSVALCQGDVAEARSLYTESLAIRQALGERLGIAECLEGLAGVAGTQGQTIRSARLFGAAEAVRKAIGAPLPPSDRAGYDRNVSLARDGLDENAFATAWARGHEMSLEQAIEYALASGRPSGTV